MLASYFISVYYQSCNKTSNTSAKMKFVVLLAVLGVAFAAPAAENQLGSLIDDFKDLLKLIPVDKIRAIAKEHLANDAEFGNVVRYLQGDDWAKLVNEVKGKSEVQDFENYMKEAGLDIGAFAARIHKFIADLKPGTQPSKDENIRAFLDEVEDEIPVDKLIALLSDKMEHSEDFKAFYNKISSQKAKQLVEEIRALPEVQRLAKRLTDMGVKVKEFLELVYDFLGWN